MKGVDISQKDSQNLNILGGGYYSFQVLVN